MSLRHLRRSLILLMCASLLPTATPAKADSLKTDAELIIAGVALAGAAIGVGIYYAFNHAHSIKGCAASGVNGLELKGEGDSQTFLLVGVTSEIKQGDRVRVKVKHKKLAKGTRATPPSWLIILQWTMVRAKYPRRLHNRVSGAPGPASRTWETTNHTL